MNTETIENTSTENTDIIPMTEAEYNEGQESEVDQELAPEAVELSSEEEDAALELATRPDPVVDETPPKTLPSATETKSPAKEKSVHKSFLAAAQAHATALGFAVEDQKAFLKIVNGETGHKIYVSKGGKEVTIETTLPSDVLGDLGQPYDGTNGRIKSNVNSKLEDLAGALDVLKNFDGKLPPPRSAKKADSATK